MVVELAARLVEEEAISAVLLVEAELWKELWKEHWWVLSAMQDIVRTLSGLALLRW